MPSQLARLAGAHGQRMRRTDPMSDAVSMGVMTRNLSDTRKSNRMQAELDAVERQRKYGFEDAEERRKQAQEGRESTQFANEQQQAQMAKWLGPATAASTSEKWSAAQDQGFLPKGMPFEAREPFMMFALTEKDRLDREKQAVSSDLAERKFGLDREKFGETKRSNRATEGISRDKAKSTVASTGRGVKTTEEKLVSDIVDSHFGRYNPVTGIYVPTSKKAGETAKAQKIKTRALQLAKHNPDLTLNMATTMALEEAGIEIREEGRTPATRQDDPLGWRQ